MQSRILSIKIIKGAKVTRSTSAYALPLFLPRPENQGKNNLSKVHSWEQPRNSFPHPVLTYHFLVPIGALVYKKCSKTLASLDFVFLYSCFLFLMMHFGQQFLILKRQFSRNFFLRVWRETAVFTERRQNSNEKMGNRFLGISQVLKNDQLF